MMKRSLALGALMAFVITGSAMAASGIVANKDTGNIQSTEGVIEGVSTAILANGSGTVEKSVSVKLEADDIKIAATANGLQTQYGGNIELKSANDIKIALSNKSNVFGIKSESSSKYETAKIKLSGNIVAIEAIGTGKNPKAIENNTNSTVEINANDIIFKTDGDYSVGVSNTSGNDASTPVKTDSKILLNGKNKVEIDVFGENFATGIKTSKYLADTTINSENLNIKAYASKGNAQGVRTELNGIINLNAKSIEISASTDSDKETKYAIATYSKGEGTINIGDENTDKVVLKAENKAGLAFTVNIEENKNGKADGGAINISGSEVEIVALGNNARGINSSGGGSVIVGNEDSIVKIKATGVKDAVGIASFEHGTTTINGSSLVIEVEASDENGTASGIHAQNNGKGGELATVNVNSINTVIKAEDAITAYSEGVVNVNGNIYTEGKNAVVARGDAQVNINTEGKNNIVQMNGDIVFDVTNDGQSGLDADANVNIKLTNADSYLKGNVIKSQSGSDEGVDMTVNGMELEVANGGTWSADADSFVNNLTVKDGGIINMAGNGQKLSIDNLTADSAIVKTNDVNNQMVVSKDANAQNVTVEGSGAIADQIAAGETDASKLADVVVKKDETAGTSTTVVDKVTTDEGVIGGRFEGFVDEKGNVTGSQAKNTTNTAISEMGSIALMAWRQENNDMNKRLGELRNSNGEHGIWTRMTRGESEFKSVKNQYNAYQIGYDEKLSTDKSWTVGAALTYTDAQSSFAGGSGENTHKGFAVYGSKLNEDGSFIDLIAKYARLEHEFDAVGGIGKGEYDTNGYSVSAEYGKRFEKGNGFWVEPQVELTYGKVGSVNYATDKAMAYQDGMESLVGRVGFSLGKDIKDGNVYVRASYLYDFDGETEVTMMSKDGKASDTYEQDLGGGWFEVGVGTNINLSDATYVYFDVEKTYGGDVATPWQWNAGVRYSF